MTGVAKPSPTQPAAGAKTYGWPDLLSSIREQVGSKLPASFAIIGVSSVLEGAGLVLLLPIAEVVFSQNTGSNAASSLMLNILAGIGADTIMSQLALLSALFMLLMIIRATVLLKRDVMLMQLSQGYVDSVRQDFFESLAHAEWPVIKRFERAHLLNNMTTNIGRISSALRFLTQGLITLALMLAYLVSAFFVDTTIGVILLVITAIVGVLSIYRLRTSHQLGDRMTKGNRGVMKETTRFLDGLKAAKACQAENEFARRFRSSIDNTRAISVEFTVQQSRMRRMIELIGAAAAIALLLFGYGVMNLSGAELLIMGAIIIRLVPNLVASFSGLQSVAYALPAYASAAAIREEIERENTVQRDVEDVADDGWDVFSELRLSDVSVVVGTGDARKTLLQVDQLTLASTGLVHVAGPSGSGKSTLVELIAGLFHPATGVMEIDSNRGKIVLDPDSRRAWQNLLSYAPQEPFLFDGSVRENLCWPNIERTDDQIWDALVLAKADRLVRDLPLQLDEQLLDGGNRLSGGERQRICLARALLRPSKLLILDEATSAVDNAIESDIHRNLAVLAREKLVLLVSHSAVSGDMAGGQIIVTDGVVKTG